MPADRLATKVALANHQRDIFVAIEVLGTFFSKASAVIRVICGKMHEGPLENKGRWAYLTWRKARRSKYKRDACTKHTLKMYNFEHTIMKQDIKVSVDAVVFGYDPVQGISVLLIKRRNEPFQKMWALPGGLVLNAESLDEAVQRELKEEAGMDVNYLEQLYTFGNPGRDPRNHAISISYFGLVRPADFQIAAHTDAEDAAWFSIKKLPKLAFDHKKIIDAAIKRLRGKITYEPVGFELLEQEFPFSDLEKLYQTLLDQDIDRRNFKKKIMSLGILEEMKTTLQRKSGRPARLYKFNRKKYFELKEKGYNFDIFF
jgi:8-oxo-dGTP diphosphatase